MNDNENTLVKNRLGSLVLFVYFAIAASLFSYFGWFYLKKHYGFSPNSTDWGSFGDFFNGFVSPIVGFVTVVLVYRAYLTQEKELTEAKSALNAQVEQSKITAKREMLWKSAENVFLEITKRFKKNEKVLAADLWGGIAELRDPAAATAVLNVVYVPLLWELNRYLKSIDQLTGNDSSSTDYFRRRVENLFGAFGEECSDLNDVLVHLKPKLSWTALREA